MCKRNILTIVAVAILALASGQAQAETITVPNDEFLMYKPGTNYTVTATFQSGNVYASGVGDNVAVKGGSVDYSDGTTGTVIDVPGWKGLTGNNDLLNNGMDGSVGYNAFGTWSGGTGTTAESADSLGNIEGGRTYTLSAMVSGPAGPLVLDLLANGVVITPSSSVTPPASAVGDWQEISRTYNAAAIADYVGQAMTISLGTRAVAPEVYFGTRVVFDNVSLTYIPLLQASAPIPADEATDLDRDVVLSWTPGIHANTHDVYFGTDEAKVTDADRANPEDVLISQGQSATSYDVGRLEFGQTYYWRVDEVNAPPDSSIFKGSIWSFATEPIAYPVDGQTITVTASSADSVQGPENTVNGSGLASDLHSDELTAMWLTALGATGPAWIQYEFDRVLKLDQMWVWNHNGLLEPAIGFGAKDVTIEYSTNGTDFTALGTSHEFARAPGKAGYAHNTIVDFGGITAKYVRLTANSNWGGILKQYGLSEVRFLSIPVLAREPNPASGAADVRVDATLGWRSGREAARHDVYLSADEQAVIDGTAPAVTVTSPSYAPSLDLAGTYYWRVEEVNDVEVPSTWQGDIWSLSTQEYLVVDDFESYNDIDAGQEGSDLVYGAWIDGFGTTTNGSTIGYFEAFQPSMEKTVIYDGKQSVPLFYNNTTASLSEVTANAANLQAGRDWTKHGIKALTLRFFGDPANAAQQMYVKINGTKVTYDGSAENLRRTGWQMWYIDLASLGVNLGNVTTLAIGLERIGTLGGQGMILLDGVRLYSYDRQLTTPVDPGTAGLQAQYPFEGNANDSSGKGRNGTVMGGPLFVAGQAGQAISLDGTDDYVTITGYKGILADAAGVQQPCTITAWVKTTDSGDRTIASWGTNTSMLRVDFRLYQGRLRVEHGGGNVQADTTLNDDNWHHVALTMIQGATISYPDVQLWLDGKDDTRPSTTAAAFSITAGVDMAIGYRATAAARYFLGAIDDVRLYDRLLSEEEIAWLAGQTMSFDKPF